MEIKVKVNGVEAVVTVNSASEAALLLAAIAQQASPSGTPVSREAIQQTPENQEAIDLHDESIPKDDSSQHAENEWSEEDVREALLTMRGNPSARLISLVAKHASGCHDGIIRQHDDFGDSVNLGPIFSHVTKACKREGVPLEALLEKRSRRGKKGKVHYHYKVTDLAKKLIATIDDFERGDDFPIDTPDYSDI